MPPTFRPTPGKYAVELVHNRLVRVTGYGLDVSGDHVEVQSLGPYGARTRLPLGSIRRLTDAERVELSAMLDAFR